jgi:hypothetical protein
VAIDIRATGSRPATLRLLLGFGFVAALFALSDTPVGALALLPVIPIAIRIATTRVRSEGDRLRVRNVFRSFDVVRNETVGFEVEDRATFRHFRERIVAVRSNDGRSRRITATAHAYRKFVSRTPRIGARNEADTICADLNTWLAEGGA